jgi:pimeloyl-ACP methyl ester carboxylesterase
MRFLIAPARSALVGLTGLALVACSSAPPIHVVRLDMQEVREELTSSVITTGKPSTESNIVLQKRGLVDQYEADRPGTLEVLHDSYARNPDDTALLFTLAELSFDHADRGGGRRYYLASAIYAWAFLFGPAAGADADVFDPRGRLVANLYNLGLAKGFASQDGKNVRVVGGVRKLPFGTIDVAFDDSKLVWGGRKLVRFVSASELGVRGLRNRYRTPGVGAPLNASTTEIEGVAPAGIEVPPVIKVPVTMLLRIDDLPAALRGGALRGRLEVHTTADAPTVEVGQRTVPLEFEPTSALADSLGGSQIWDTEFAGFLRGDLLQIEKRPQLGAIEPYRSEKVPVVFVHGTASSPARWAQMVNDLTNEPELRRHFQAWFFSYDTGNPILYSAMQLREALTKTVAALDPAGTNACLRQMVVIGHSQGGLLTKLTAVKSGDAFWHNASEKPFDQVELPPETRDLLRRALFLDPLSFVRRLIFVATPHRGSYRAGSLARRLVQRLVRLPGNLVGISSDLLTTGTLTPAATHMRRLPTSVDNMAPNSPFDKALNSLSIAPGVTAHSIIAVKGDGPVETGGDGVVKYQSAHITGVESELVVRSPHSCQANPHTIEEVRRILLEHSATVFDGDRCRMVPVPR